MYALEGQVTVFEPGRTGCLACLYPEKPAHWRREFPVLGAVSGTVACLAAVEVVKLLTGLGKPLAGTLLTMDLGTMHFRRHACAGAPTVRSAAGSLFRDRRNLNAESGSEFPSRYCGKVTSQRGRGPSPAFLHR